MEAEEIQPQTCKFPRTDNGTGRRGVPAEVVQIMGSASDHQCPKGEEGVQLKGSRHFGTVVETDESGLVQGWPHHSRIVRVSRATGGKDRHSKVLTSKGLRDRRVRLSVPTAIQFYDVQDRLGYNQPSKAMEWLIKAAANSISELPSLSGSFTGSSTEQLSRDERRTSTGNATEQQGLDSADIEGDGDPGPNSQHVQQNQNLSLSKSACSSATETSKGSSSLLLPGSELRESPVHARPRIDKEKKARGCNQQPLNLILQSSSFTDLLTGRISMSNTVNTTTTSNVPSGSSHQDSGNCTRQWSSAAMDYFDSGLLSAPLSRSSSRFAAQLQTANNPIPQALPITPPSTISTDSDGGNHHAQYSFVHEGFIPIAATASSSGAEYNQNFMISSSSSGSPASGGLGGFNRGTLQSNSSSQQQSLPSYLQRFSATEGQPSPHRQNASMPFFIGTAAPPDNQDHNHNTQFPPGFDGQLQLYYWHGTKEEPQK